MTPGKLLIVLIFCMVLRGGFVILANGTSEITNYYVDLAGQIGMSLAIYFFCIYEFKINKYVRKEIFGSLRLGGIVGGAALALTLLCFTFGESALLSLVISQIDRPLAYRLGNFHDFGFPAHPFFSIHVMLFMSANVVMPAIVEEFFFRGLLFPSLQSKKSFFWSAAISSIIFTVLHFSKIVYVSTFLFAFILCYLYAYTRSLYPCITMHGIYNFLAFVNQHYFDFHRIRSIDQLSAISDWLPQLCMLLGSIAILGAILYKHKGAGQRELRIELPQALKQ